MNCHPERSEGPALVGMTADDNSQPIRASKPWLASSESSSLGTFLQINSSSFRPAPWIFSAIQYKITINAGKGKFFSELANSRAVTSPTARNERVKRKGGNDFMAKVIEFYIPNRFRKPPAKWTPAEQRGKVLEFRPLLQKSA
jgi:hypothetical protein